jgi:LmbE family N-acetylglucosaminyl deacetylase
LQRGIQFSASDRVLVIAPHPDDESLVAGGALARALAAGAHLRVIFATDGDNAPWIQRRFERRWRIGEAERARFGVLRRGEAVRAVAALGLDASSAIFLGIPDQGVGAALLDGGSSIVADLRSQIEAARPTLIIAPSLFDLHPDHNALAVVLELALQQLGRGVARPRVLSYIVHSHTTPGARRDTYSLWLSEDERKRKRNAVLCYESQLSVHRKLYLEFEREREIFFEDDQELAVRVQHPVRYVALEGTRLRVRVAPPAGLRALRSATVFVIGARADGRRESLAIRLGRGDGELPVVRSADGQVVARAKQQRTQGALELLVPLGSLAGASALFVKLDNRLCFFDRGGWMRVGPGTVKHAESLLETRQFVRASPFVCAVIPCYQVARYCVPVVRDAARHADLVLAFDDGSTDGTGERLRELAANSNGRIEVLSAPVNRGKGVALLSAFAHALAHVPFDVLVTLDGDGQHRPADIERLASAWQGGADFVVGAREAFASMPLRSRIGNTLTSALMRRVSRACPADTQSGFRAHDRSFVEEITLNVGGARYETEARILTLALRTRRTIASVPIPTVYLDDNRSSHFRPVADSTRILAVLFEQGLAAVRAAIAEQRN